MRTRAATCSAVLALASLAGCCRTGGSPGKPRLADQWLHDAVHGSYERRQSDVWLREAVRGSREPRQSDLWWREVRCCATGR